MAVTRAAGMRGHGASGPQLRPLEQMPGLAVGGFYNLVFVAKARLTNAWEGGRSPAAPLTVSDNGVRRALSARQRGARASIPPKWRAQRAPQHRDGSEAPPDDGTRGHPSPLHTHTQRTRRAAEGPNPPADTGALLSVARGQDVLGRQSQVQTPVSDLQTEGFPTHTFPPPVHNDPQ